MIESGFCYHSRMLETNRLLLIPVDSEILDSLLESDDAFSQKYDLINDGGEFLTPSLDYLRKIRQRLTDHPEEYPFAVDYMIVVKDMKTVIGSIDYKYMPDDSGVSEIGYGMSPQYEGRGYMTEALSAMVSYGKEYGLKRVIADTLIENTKSQNVLKRCGFTFSKQEGNKYWFVKEL